MKVTLKTLFSLGPKHAKKYKNMFIFLPNVIETTTTKKTPTFFQPNSGHNMGVEAKMESGHTFLRFLVNPTLPHEWIISLILNCKASGLGGVLSKV